MIVCVKDAVDAMETEVSKPVIGSPTTLYETPLDMVEKGSVVAVDGLLIKFAFPTGNM